MSFNTFLSRFILLMTFVQLGVNGAALKSPSCTGKQTSTTRRNTHTSRSTSSPSHHSMASNSRSTVSGSAMSAKAKSSNIPSGSVSSVGPSASSRACSIKRSLSKRACENKDEAPWQLEWISTRDVNVAPWNKMPTNCIVQSIFRWSYDPAWGSDVLIFVIDSGVKKDHEAFVHGQVESGATVTALKTDSEADASTSVDGHGTSVASLIVGHANGIAHKGTIFPIKVSTSTGSTSNDDMAEAITIALNTWRVRSRENPALRAIINISFQVFHTAKALRAVQLALDAGMHVVVAAGNEGINGCYEDPVTPIEDSYLESIGQIVVSGTTISRGGGVVRDAYVSDYNYGSCVDIFAPAEPVVVAHLTAGYATDAGTSLAAALVSGTLAALLSRGSRFRDHSPATMKEYFLRQYGQDGVHGVPAGTVNKRLVIEGLT